MKTTELKLLVLADSPTLHTGFARVIRNLLPLWAPSFPGGIDVWAIGYQGWPHELPCRLFPATHEGDREWQSDGNLERFLTMLDSGGYTHVWMMQDLFHVARMAEALPKVCRSRKIRSLLYYPVDAPVSEFWVKAATNVDVAVAYTEYGYGEMKKHASAAHLKKHVIPHGTDLGVYHPLESSRLQARAMFATSEGRQLIGDDDFLIAAVSAHQKRKGLAQTLQVFRALREELPRDCGRPVLYLHMPPLNPAEGSDLKLLALEMGLSGEVLFADGSFSGNASRLNESHMPLIYRAADLLLTTTHGEGWGLPITEAMACGTPVAGPRHTAVAELLGNAQGTETDRGVLFGCNAEIVLPADNMRQRPVTDVADAAAAIAQAIDLPEQHECSLFSKRDRALEWVSRPEFRWENIAARWLELMEV